MNAVVYPSVSGGTQTPWGPWLTLSFGAVVAVLFSTAQMLAIVPMVLLYAIAGTAHSNLLAIAMSGLNLSIAMIVSCPVLLTACALLVRLRQGPSIQDYLALYPVKPREIARWVVVMLAVIVVEFFLDAAMQRPIPEFMLRTYSTAGYLPLLWAAIAVCAPVGEEVFFRGFLFKGLAASKLGNVGALLVTTVLFAMMHIGQYGVFELLQITISGVAIGWARMRTGSVLPSIAMHLTLNMVSLIDFELSGYADAR